LNVISLNGIDLLAFRFVVPAAGTTDARMPIVTIQNVRNLRTFIRILMEILKMTVVGCAGTPRPKILENHPGVN